MKRLKEHPKAILAAIFGIVGMCSVVFGKTIFVQGGLTCICWGIAVLILSYIANARNLRICNNFDIDARNILIDIAENGERSEYYMFYNIEKLEKIRNFSFYNENVI